MIPEAPFLFSIAGLSASLAGLAGLVVGLRRGSDLGALDVFRLRQIVEFSFANVILALGTVPLALALDSIGRAIQIGAIAALAYVASTALFLERRMRREGIHWTPGWRIGVLVLTTVLLALSIAAIATGAIAMYEGLLVALLARPMLAFLLVIASFGGRPAPPPSS